MTATSSDAETPDATGSEATASTGATGSPEATTSPSTTGSPSATGTTGAGATGVDADVEQFVQDFITAYNDGDAEAFFGAMTDEAAAEFLVLFGLDATDLEAAKEEAAPFLGEEPIEIEEINVTESSDSAATAEMIGASGGVLEGDLIELTREGDEWMVSSLQLFAVSPPVPSGYDGRHDP